MLAVKRDVSVSSGFCDETHVRYLQIAFSEAILLDSTENV